jgi:hypothetical protein
MPTVKAEDGKAVTMRRANRVFLIALLPLTLALGGCETSSFWDSANNASDRFQDMLGSFNPFGTSKKPLPGERRAVFPEGVPGVQQGVPPELMRGNQQAGDTEAQPPPAPEPKGKTKKAAKTKAQGRGVADSSDPPEDGVWPPPPAR